MKMEVRCKMNSNKPAVIDFVVKYETHEITRLLQSAYYNPEM